MTSRTNSRLTVTLAYAFLLAATAVSWELGQGTFFQSARNAGTVILIIAFVKIRTVILYFMEIGHAPIGFRIAAEIWAAGVCSALIVLYR